MSKGSGLVFGVGFNDLKESGTIGRCVYYEKWYSMLRRCYSTKYHSKKSYNGVVVSEDWLVFSKFKDWLSASLSELPEGYYDLDKDLLQGNNKLYSASTCVLLPSHINQFIKDNPPHKPSQGNEVGIKLMSSGKWSVRVCHPITKRREQKTKFDSKEEAKNYWYCKKDEYMKLLVEVYEGVLPSSTKEALLNYYKTL